MDHISLTPYERLSLSNQYRILARQEFLKCKAQGSEREDRNKHEYMNFITLAEALEKGYVSNYTSSILNLSIEELDSHVAEEVREIWLMLGNLSYSIEKLTSEEVSQLPDIFKFKGFDRYGSSEGHYQYARRATERGFYEDWKDAFDTKFGMKFDMYIKMLSVYNEFLKGEESTSSRNTNLTLKDFQELERMMKNQ